MTQRANGTGDFSIEGEFASADTSAFDLAGDRISKRSGWDTDRDGVIETGETITETIAYSYNDRDELCAD